MAPLDAMIKTLTATLLVLGSLLLPGHSATSSMKRGHNLDQWTTWTGVEKWNEPERARDDLYAQVMGDPAIFDAYVEVVRKMAHTRSGSDPSQDAFEPMN